MKSISLSVIVEYGNYIRIAVKYVDFQVIFTRQGYPALGQIIIFIRGETTQAVKTLLALFYDK